MTQPSAVLTPPTASQVPMRCLLSVSTPYPASGPRTAQPVTFGVPLPRGFARDIGELSLTDARGPRAAQLRALDTWSDGSVRWVLVDTQIDLGTPGASQLELVRGPQVPTHGPHLRHETEAGSVVIDTGAARFSFALDGSTFPMMVTSGDGGPAARCALDILGKSGTAGRLQWNTPTLEECGPLRATVRLDGSCRLSEGKDRVELFARVHLYAGSPTARMQITVRNPRRAQHPGGFWDLGDPGSVLLKDVSFAVRAPAPANRVDYSVERGSPAKSCSPSFELYQDSSGGEQWNSVNHINRNRVVPTPFRGYRLTAGDAQAEGLRATPAVRSAGADRTHRGGHRRVLGELPEGD